MNRVVTSPDKREVAGSNPALRDDPQIAQGLERLTFDSRLFPGLFFEIIIWWCM